MDKITRKDEIKFVAEGLRNLAVALMAGGFIAFITLQRQPQSSSPDYIDIILASTLILLGVVAFFGPYQILKGGEK